LITIRQQGRDHFCEAKLEKLNEVNDWVAQYKEFWNKKFDALELYLDQLQKKDKKKKAPSIHPTRGYRSSGRKHKVPRQKK
jgi:hypothetical protein